jgi:hypothetical protein
VSKKDEGKSAKKRKKAEAARRPRWLKREAQRITGQLDTEGTISYVRLFSLLCFSFCRAYLWVLSMYVRYT